MDLAQVIQHQNHPMFPDGWYVWNDGVLTGPMRDTEACLMRDRINEDKQNSTGYCPTCHGD